MTKINIFLNFYRRLYVLEDIDAADLKETVGERSEKEGGKSKNKKKEKEDNDDSDCESSQGTSRKPEEDIDFNLLHLLKPTALDKLGKSNKLTLASLLEVLDGVMEMDGRMIGKCLINRLFFGRFSGTQGS